IGSSESEFTTYFSESILARVYLVFKLDKGAPPHVDVAALQAGIVNITRSWEDFLLGALLEAHGEEASAQLLREYRDAFSSSYQEEYDARTAVQDIHTISTLLNKVADTSLTVTPIALSIYQVRGQEQSTYL